MALNSHVVAMERFMNFLNIMHQIKNYAYQCLVFLCIWFQQIIPNLIQGHQLFATEGYLGTY